LLDSRAVLHEWHDPVNNPARPSRQAGQAADFASDSDRADDPLPGRSNTEDRCRLGFVPFWRSRRA